MALPLHCTPGKKEGDISFGLAPGGQDAMATWDSDAANDGTITLAFTVPEGVDIPTGQKTLHLAFSGGGTSGLYRIVVSHLRVVKAGGDPEASYGSTTNIDVTMTADRDDDNFVEEHDFTETLAAGDTLLFKVTHDSSETTVTGEFLHLREAHIAWPDA